MSTPVADTPTHREFLLRRLHSLLGLIPIGVFLCMHLSVNSLIAFSEGEEDYYQRAVNRIHGLGPFLVPVEIVGIFLPIAFHAIIGLKITYTSKPNVGSYWHWCNIRYTLQRITGVVVLLFILVHLWHMHWLGEYVPGESGAMFDPKQASTTAAYAMQTHRAWVIPVYALGILAACYHFATGLWTFMINWGITVGEKAQDRAGYFCAGVGILLAIIGLIAQFRFLTYPNPIPKRPPPAAARWWDSAEPTRSLIGAVGEAGDSHPAAGGPTPGSAVPQAGITSASFYRHIEPKGGTGPARPSCLQGSPASRSGDHG